MKLDDIEKGIESSAKQVFAEAMANPYVLAVLCIVAAVSFAVGKLT